MGLRWAVALRPFAAAWPFLAKGHAFDTQNLFLDIKKYPFGYGCRLGVAARAGVARGRSARLVGGSAQLLKLSIV